MLTELEGIHMQSLSSWPLQIDFVFLTKCRADVKQKCFSTYFKYERKKGDNENKTKIVYDYYLELVKLKGYPAMKNTWYLLES